MIVVLANQDSFPCGPERPVQVLASRRGYSTRARLEGLTNTHQACWPGDGLAVQVLRFPLAGPPVARLLACMRPLRPLDSRFPTLDLSRAPRPSSLLFLCPSYSNSKAQFLKIELILGRKNGARFPTQTAKFQHERKRAKRAAHRSEDGLRERAGREPRNGRRRKGARGHDPAGGRGGGFPRRTSERGRRGREGGSGSRARPLRQISRQGRCG